MDDRSSHTTPGALPPDRRDRLAGVRDTALPRAFERQLHGQGEPFSPEIGRNACDRPGHFVLVAIVEREGHDAEACVADRDIVDVELERGRERVGLGRGHRKETWRTVGGAMQQSKQDIRDRSVPSL